MAGVLLRVVLRTIGVQYLLLSLAAASHTWAVWGHLLRGAVSKGTVYLHDAATIAGRFPQSGGGISLGTQLSYRVAEQFRLVQALREIPAGSLGP